MATKKTAIVKWDAELSKLATAATAVEENVGAGGNIIGTAGGRLKFKGAAVPGNKMNVVVVAHCIAYMDYEGNFDPDNPASPRCFAFGRDEKKMVPHEKSVDKQCDTCAECEQNVFGSAERGKGKHCKNSRRLAIITEGDLEDAAAAEVAYIHVPVTSVKAWAGYVRQVADTLHRPPLGVVTELRLVPDDKNQFAMEFEVKKSIDDGEMIGALLELGKAQEKAIEFPYLPFEGNDEKPTKGKKAPAKKAPAKKGQKF